VRRGAAAAKQAGFRQWKGAQAQADNAGAAPVGALQRFQQGRRCATAVVVPGRQDDDIGAAQR
jgi:hypothetical protein